MIKNIIGFKIVKLNIVKMYCHSHSKTVFNTLKDPKNIYPRKTIHEKSRRIIYEFSYKMGVLNEKGCKKNKLMKRIVY